VNYEPNQLGGDLILAVHQTRLLRKDLSSNPCD